MCYWKRCCRLSHTSANKGEKTPDLQVIASHEKSHPPDCSRPEGGTFLMSLCSILWYKPHHFCFGLGVVWSISRKRNVWRLAQWGACHGSQGWPRPARGTCLQGLGTGARGCWATCPVPGGPLAAQGTVWGLRDPPQLRTPFAQD